jgi:hypothetical protein
MSIFTARSSGACLIYNKGTKIVYFEGFRVGLSWARAKPLPLRFLGLCLVGLAAHGGGCLCEGASGEGGARLGGGARPCPPLTLPPGRDLPILAQGPQDQAVDFRRGCAR